MTKPALYRRIVGQEWFGPLVALLIIVAIVAATTPTFLEPQNFRNLALQVSILSIVAIGSTIVIITGGIDLSPGSMIAFLTMCLAVFIKNQGLDLWAAIPLTLLIGCALGMVNGVLVAYVGIPAFIVTLAGLSAFKGLALTLERWHAGLLAVAGTWADLLRDVPRPAVAILLRRRRLPRLHHHHGTHAPGREIYAVGGNESAARLSGINVARVRLIAFLFAGFARP
jgi:ribose transport system permease protein